MVERPKIVVIGAGMGGLAAAAVLSRRCDVTVIDKGQAAGGKVRQVSVGGALIDSGPTVFTMDWAFRDVFASAGAQLEDFVDMTPLDVLARHAWPDAGRLDLFASVEESAEAIATFSGRREANNFRAFAKKSQEMFETLCGPFILAESPSMPALLSRRSPLSLLKTSPFSTLWSALGKTFRDPRLQQLFGRYATYCGASPFSAPATLMLIAHVEQAGVWALKGGMQAIAEALEAVGRKNGAAYRFEETVDEVEVSGGRVSGVRLSGGERVPADRIVFNGDVAALASGALGSDARRAATLPEGIQRSQSAITWSGLATASGMDFDMHNVFFSEDYAAEFDAVFEQDRPPADPTVYICAQDCAPGTERSAPHRVLCLTNAPANGDRHTYSEKEIEQCQDRMLRQVRRCGVDLTFQGSPEVTTPNQFNAMFPATGGGLYGMASHGWAASFQRPGVRSKIRGLYLAGGSVHPGPGAPMAALSGLAAARAAMADFGST